MLSAILGWFKSILHDDRDCLAHADALTFDLWSTDTNDPNYLEKVAELTKFVNSCILLNHRPDYQALLEELAAADNHTLLAA